MTKLIGLNPTGKKGDPLYEAHPIGIQNNLLKIIQGDLRTKTWTDNENTVHSVQAISGTLIYDRDDKPNRPWFLLAYESGNRIEN